MNLLLAMFMGFIVVALHTPSASAGILPDDFVDLPVVGPLDTPTAFAFLPDGRILITELLTSKVRLAVADSIAAPDPVFIVDSIDVVTPESGLLGVAVDPRWPASPYIYVHYVHDGSPYIHVARYTATGDLDFTSDGSLTVDPGSRYIVIRLPNDAPPHNGGHLLFGRDDMLYVANGDDLGNCIAQDLTSLKGKILRLDVFSLPAGPGGPAPLSLITPPDNPFSAHADSNARLVYHYGLRNPFSFDMDPWTGDMFIADVGADSVEEFNWSETPGTNFGWPEREGPMITGMTCPGSDSTEFVDPIAYYEHGTGPHTIISAGIYRPPLGATTPFPSEYNGDAFYHGFYGFFLRRVTRTGDNWNPAPPVPGQPNPGDWHSFLPWCVDFEVGPEGALYYLRMWTAFPQPDGQLRRIVYTGTLDAKPVPMANRRLLVRPLPARGDVSLTVTMEWAGRVSLVIGDISGREVRSLHAPARLEFGRHRFVWDGTAEDGRTVPPGVYFAHLRVNEEREVRRLVLIR